MGAAQWDRDIRVLGGSLFHSYEWNQFRSFHGSRPLFFRWTDQGSGEPVGLTVGIERPPANSRRGRVASYVTIDTPPATAHVGIDFVEPVRRWARTSGRPIIEVRLGSFDPRSQWSPTSPPRPISRYEFLVPPRTPGEVLRAMRKGTRSSVKRAERLSVEIRSGGSPADLLEFARLYALTVTQLQQKKRVSPDRYNPETHAAALEVLMRHGAGRVYLAWRDGEPIAGCLFGIWDASAYYLQNGAHPAARDCGAVHLTLHRAITELLKQGFTRINLGGVPADARHTSSIDHGLYAFKLGLGAEPFACTGGSLMIRPHRAKAVSIVRRHQILLRELMPPHPAPLTPRARAQ
jgi:Acetyltransferase (GNAT) domain